MCLYEQEISKFQQFNFAFLILELNSCFMGVGFKDIIQKNNYTGIGYESVSYLIRHDGYIFSHHQQHLNNKQISFYFTSNDIILVKVNITEKYIRWTKNNTVQSIIMEINTEEELYPCVIINKSKVKIFDIIQ
ncbi:unnamed protein product [Paramecium sonneborni]|uniref:SPRY domain-containing protein n=1 Tax=Paramecium sonneborni TaxID=65129 RepID=A0A8S1R4R0_9CILI|nr:unnamed protein product [Paramecium sonneborni]